MTSPLSNQKPVVFIGAAGEMCRLAIQRFATASDAPLVLCDINKPVIETLRDNLPAGRATTLELNLYDHNAVVDAIKDAALVVLGAGPYTKTSQPVLKACLETKVPYLDFDDDVESTQDALSMNEMAKKEGVPCYIGCGSSPGMSNVMAIDVARELDTVDTLDLCWLVGDEKSGAGKAVLHHLMHIAAGPCLTWADGGPTINESWVETGYAPMIGHSNEIMLHETAHPEPVTLPRLFPNAKRIRCLGGLDPPPKMGIARGLGSAVRRGDLTIDEAVDFHYKMRSDQLSLGDLSKALSGVVNVLRGGNLTVGEMYDTFTQTGQSLGPWRYALMGMVDQVRSGECTLGEVLDFIVRYARGQNAPYRGGMLVRAVGTRNGCPTVVIKRTRKCGPDAFLFRSMGTVTGTCCAAFMVMALEAGKTRSGVFSPEDWAEPKEFYKALERVGTPTDDIVESYTYK